MGKGQFSYFFVRGYFQSDEEVRIALDCVGYRHYAYICHDRDVYTDDSESHVKGDLKKKHYHLCVNLMSACSWRVLKARIEHNFVNHDLGLRVEDIHDPAEAKDYLMHCSKHSIDSGKVRYEVKEVRTDDITYWDSSQAKQEVHDEHCDYIWEFAQEVFELGWCPPFTLHNYAKKYGRDFIFNYRRALQFCADALAIGLEEIFKCPEHRAGLRCQGRYEEDK